MDQLINFLILPDEKFRYERKYVFDRSCRNETSIVIRQHSSHFSSIYDQRYVNNIYFDTPFQKSFWDNIDGKAQRIKFRIRWYGELSGTVKEPCLEIKIKRGLCGYKRRFPLKLFNFEKNFLDRNIRQCLLDSNLPEIVLTYIKGYKVSLVNRYRRKYFQTFDRFYRLTWDKDIQFFGLKGGDPRCVFDGLYHMDDILELKYDQEYDQGVEKISNEFPFRVSRNSKYVMGMRLSE